MEEVKLIMFALDYIKRGFSIIPVGIDKKPLINWKEFQERKPTEEEVHGWFQQWGDSIKGLGLVTGVTSGLVVVDIEKDGSIDNLPHTVISQSGGGGFHYYFKYDQLRPIKNYTRVRNLTDIRGDGGYIILPPSLHSSGQRYEWIYGLDETPLAVFPYWLIESLEINLPVSNGKVFNGERNTIATSYAGKLLCQFTPEDWETKAWSIFLTWNQQNCQPPLIEKELRTIWNSIKDRESKKISKKEEKRNTLEVYSKRFKDGSILETIYDSEMESTHYSLFKDGLTTKLESHNFNGITYTPPSSTNAIIANKHVKLPSATIDFVSETQLLKEVRLFIHDYVEISEEFEQIATYYVLFTWVFDAFKEVPYLRVLGDYGSGKSRMLQVMDSLCYKALALNGASSVSSIFRIINDIHGTVILDEADFSYSDTTQEIVKILNSGFQAGVAVYRSESKGGKTKTYDATPFDVFCPKVIATREVFKDEALESRCLTYAMSPLTRQDIKENLDDSFYKRALEMRNKLLTFRFQKISKGISFTRMPSMSIEPRLRQIITPLYSILEDEQMKAQIVQFVEKKQETMTDQRFDSFEGEVFQSLLLLLEGDLDNTEISMSDITEKYNGLFASEKYHVKPKRIGLVVGNIFHLEKHKTATGIRILRNERNEQHIEKLKIKYGIHEKEENVVNIVDLPWDEQPKLIE